MTPGKNAALIAPRKHEKSQGHYHHRYMVSRAILAKVCRCKPNRRSRGDADFKQGSKLPKVNYFPPGCIGVGFSTRRCRMRSVTVSTPRFDVIEQETDDAEVGFVVVEIELGAGGHMRREDFRIDGEVEHGQVTPVRGQKRLQHRWRGRCQVGALIRLPIVGATRLRCDKNAETRGQRTEVRGQKSASE